MKVAFGLKVHSGWAALVAVGKRGRELEVVDRRRLVLVGENEPQWAKQPYHTAQRSNQGDAESVVESAIQFAANE